MNKTELIQNCITYDTQLADATLLRIMLFLFIILAIPIGYLLIKKFEKQ